MHIQDTLSFCLCPKLGAVLDGGRRSTNKKKICTLWFPYHSGHFLYFTKINCIIAMAYNIGHMWSYQDLSYLWI